MVHLCHFILLLWETWQVFHYVCITGHYLTWWVTVIYNKKGKEAIIHRFPAEVFFFCLTHCQISRPVTISNVCYLLKTHYHLYFRMVIQNVQPITAWSCPSFWHGLPSPVLAAVGQLGWRSRLCIQMNSGASKEPFQGSWAPGPSCYLSFTVILLSVNIHSAGHIIIGSLMFVLLPQGFILGLRGPFKQEVQFLPTNNVTCF